MRAWLRAFFQNDHRHVAAFFCGQLLEANRGGQPGRAASDHDNVVVH